MPVRYNERTGIWDFDSVEEARSFKDSQHGRPAVPAPMQQAVTVPTNGTSADLAIRVLPAIQALARAGADGMLGSKLSEIAQLKGPKGLAGFAASVEKHLRAITKREDVSDLFWRDKSPGAPATWFADSKKLKQLGVLDVDE
jgi:hypothetical protein